MLVECAEHGPAARDESRYLWHCAICSRVLTDEELARLHVPETFKGPVIMT